jgi:hypothetical protein
MPSIQIAATLEVDPRPQPSPRQMSGGTGLRSTLGAPSGHSPTPEVAATIPVPESQVTRHGPWMARYPPSHEPLE